MKKIVLALFFSWLSHDSFSQVIQKKMPVTESGDTSRHPVFNSASRMRAIAIADTATIQELSYNNTSQEYKYDPADITSPDDSVTVIVNSAGKRFKPVFKTQQIDVRLFGAKGNGSTDDWAAIQKAINTIVGNTDLPKTLFFPKGTYSISRPLIVYLWNGQTYRFCSINLVGQEAAHFNTTAPEAVIVPTFKNSFALGFQLVRSCLVKGLVIKGKFNPAGGFSNWGAYYNRPFATWVSSQDAAIRDSRFSPYAGIVIDPFINAPILPEDGGYPGLSGWYRGTDTTSGSSAVIIEDSRVFGFTTDIILSPNGRTSNAENILVRRCALEVAKVAYAVCQQQSKDNFIREAISWDRVHTLVDDVTYGARFGQPPYVDGWNVAGDIVQIANIPITNFATAFSNIFAEGIFRVGSVSGPASFSNCQFDFNLDTTRSGAVLIPASHLDGRGASFYNCSFRYYNNLNNRREVFNASASFNHCYFDDVPIGVTPYSNENYGGLSFTDCYAGSNKLLGWHDCKGQFTTGNPKIVAYGKIKVDEGGVLYLNTWSNSLNLSFDCGGAENSYLMQHVTHFTVDSIHWTAAATLTGNDKLFLAVGDYLTGFIGGVFTVFGKVSALNRKSGALTLVDCPLGTVSGNYQLFAVYYDVLGGMFVGDLTKGSPLITNVDQSTILAAPYPGQRLKIGNSFWAPVIDAISGNTITMSAPAEYSRKGITNPFFSKDYSSDRMQFQSFDIPTIPSGSSLLQKLNLLFPEGSIWVAPRSAFQTGAADQRFICIQSGYLSPSSIGKSLQAVWKNVEDVAQYKSDSTADEGLAHIYFNTTSNSLRLKNKAAWNDIAVSGAVPGWQTISAGNSGTVNNGIANVLINPATALLSYTLTMPSSPMDGAFVKIHFGGSIAGGSNVVAHLVISPNTGQTIVQSSAPSTAAGGNCFIYQYNASLAIWYREQ
jgi:hypothetical protein